MMERTEVLDMMGTLTLYGKKPPRTRRWPSPSGAMSRSASSATCSKPRFGKAGRSIKYQLTIAGLPLAKEVDDFAFKGTLINQAPVRDLASGAFYPAVTPFWSAEQEPARPIWRSPSRAMHPGRIARTVLHLRRSRQPA